MKSWIQPCLEKINADWKGKICWQRRKIRILWRVVLSK